MDIRFKADCEYEVIVNYDEVTEEATVEYDSVKKGEVIKDVKLVGPGAYIVNGKLVEDETKMNIMFADGTLAIAIPTEWYEVIGV